MATKYWDRSSRIIFSACFIFLFVSTASSYDGPAGVTFRAPYIAKAAGKNSVALERISLRVDVRIDDGWSLKIDGKGRAFPDKFIATIAESEITFILRNGGKRKIATNVLIPFDSSNTAGTGFTEPFSSEAFWEGVRVRISRGPELSRGTMKVRSYLVPVVIPAQSAAELRIVASHPLAMHPAWYQFICTDKFAEFPDFYSLTSGGCGLEFEFDSADARLKQNPFKLLWKTSPKELFTAQKSEAIKFKAESIQWVAVEK
jgi:hypothetical protein